MKTERRKAGVKLFKFVTQPFCQDGKEKGTCYVSGTFYRGKKWSETFYSVALHSLHI